MNAGTLLPMKRQIPEIVIQRADETFLDGGHRERAIVVTVGDPHGGLHAHLNIPRERNKVLMPRKNLSSAIGVASKRVRHCEMCSESDYVTETCFYRTSQSELSVTTEANFNGVTKSEKKRCFHVFFLQAALC